MFGCPDATEEQIEEALAISQAKEFVDTKEGRLDAVVEQGGKKSIPVDKDNVLRWQEH